MRQLRSAFSHILYGHASCENHGRTSAGKHQVRYLSIEALIDRKLLNITSSPPIFGFRLQWWSGVFWTETLNIPQYKCMSVFSPVFLSSFFSNSSSCSSQVYPFGATVPCRYCTASRRVEEADFAFTYAATATTDHRDPATWLSTFGRTRARGPFPASTVTCRSTKNPTWTAIVVLFTALSEPARV